MVAALFVATGGVYFGLPDVDPWDEARDARKYAGPHPVVAHPPCARWSSLAHLVQARHGHKVGDDGRCFEFALRAVNAYGGVLEHPRGTIAFKRHGILESPVRGAWSRSGKGFVTEVLQCRYGHRARKATWLYCQIGALPPSLDWSDDSTPRPVVSTFRDHSRLRGAAVKCERMGHRERLATPPAFADLLLYLARSAVRS